VGQRKIFARFLSVEFDFLYLHQLSYYYTRLHKRCNIGKSIARAGAAVIPVHKVESLYSLLPVSLTSKTHSFGLCILGAEPGRASKFISVSAGHAGNSKSPPLWDRHPPPVPISPVAF
jgi:hypothetical protein